MLLKKANVKVNLAAIRRRAGDAEIIADLSGGGQGMGLVGAAKLLREEGIRCFAVTNRRRGSAQE